MFSLCKFLSNKIRESAKSPPAQYNNELKWLLTSLDKFQTLNQFNSDNFKSEQFNSKTWHCQQRKNLLHRWLLSKIYNVTNKSRQG